MSIDSIRFQVEEPIFVKRPHRPSRFYQNAIANWVAFLFVAIVSFFLSPFIVHHLGGTAYGVWSLLVALVGYLGLFDFGVRGAVTRYVAHHHAIDEDDKCSSIVSAALVLFGILGAMAILVSGGFAYLAPLLFNIPESLVDDSRIVLFLGGVTIATTLIGAVFAGVVTGLQRFDISSGVEIAVTAIRTIAVVAALNEGYGLVVLGCIHLVASVLYGAAAWLTVRRIYPSLRFRTNAPLMPHVRTIVSFSAFLSLIHVFGLFIYYSNALVIAAFLPIASVTYYAIAGNLIDYAAKVSGALSKMMTPRVSALSSVGSDSVGGEVIVAARMATLATAPIAVTFLLRGESFVNLWMGPEFGPVSGEILRVLAVVVLLAGARSVAIASIIGMNKHRTLIPGLAFEAVANLALSIALVHSLGLLGVAIGVAIPSVMVSVMFLPRCLGKATGLRIASFIRKGWIMPTLACIPFALGSEAIERQFPAANLLVFFLQVAATLILVPLFAWYLCLSNDERKQAKMAARGLFAKRESQAGSSPSLARKIIRKGRNVIEPLEGYIFAGVLYLGVQPMAIILPEKWLRRSCRLLAFLLARITCRGRDTSSDYVSAFGGTALDGIRIAREKLYWSFWEYAVHIRVSRNRVWYRKCECIQVNREALDKVIGTDQSFIVAMGHFARDEAACWALGSNTLPRNLTHVFGPVPEIQWREPHLMHVRVVLRAMEQVLHVIHDGEIEIAMVGEESAAATKLIRRLKTTKCAFVMYVDAPWNATKHRSALSRPFAGSTNAPFALGAARLARASGCPILFCMPERIDDTQCRLVWHEPIWVPEDGGHEADIHATNMLLDAIEKGIGANPARYMMSIGEGRRWNAKEARWEDK